MKKLPEKITKKWLLKNLPVRDWNTTSKYDKVWIVPGQTKHDSGFMEIAIVGVNVDEDGEREAEIAAQPDDIQWDIGYTNEFEVRTDCLYPEAIIQFWSSGYRFLVDTALSSTIIRFVKKSD